MTDYIYETETDSKMEFVDDGRDEVVLVTYKASSLVRRYRTPRIFQKALRMLSSERERRSK